MWETKRAEEMDLAARDVEEVTAISSQSEYILILITFLVIIIIRIGNISWVIVFSFTVFSIRTSITVLFYCHEHQLDHIQ